MKNRRNHLYALACLSCFFLVQANAKPKVQDTQGNATEECDKPVKEQKADSKNESGTATDPEKKEKKARRATKNPRNRKKRQKTKPRHTRRNENLSM